MMFRHKRILILVFACTVITIGCMPIGRYLLSSSRAPLYPPKIQKDKTYHEPTERQKLWALATAAVLTENNGGCLDILGGDEPTPERAQAWRESLAKWWGVNSRADLLASLEWIEQGGHRKDFDELSKIISTASPKQVDELRKQVGDDAEAKNQVAIGLKYHRKFAKKSIAAWDFGRYVSLCGWGYVAGYFSEEEAWQRIMPGARLMQKTFESWNDFGENYIVGREFWSLEQTKRNGYSMRGSLEYLLSDPQSPWQRLPWNLDLKPGKRK